MNPTLAVIAKAPVPGRVKTRLCPPCSPEQAAELAMASLLDTLAAVRATPTVRRAVILDGELPLPGLEVLPQRGAGLDERLAHAFDDLGDPAFLVGMDTPQVTPALLATGLRALEWADAVLGPALDGGYWGIGLRVANPAVFLGVPMSEPTTLAAQRERLGALGLRVAELPALRDVDEWEDAETVAHLAPRSHFARACSRVAA